MWKKKIEQENKLWSKKKQNFNDLCLVLRVAFLFLMGNLPT